MNGKKVQSSEKHNPRFFSQKFWWWPLFGCVMAAAIYGTGHSSVAKTPLANIPTICAVSLFISFLLPLAWWVDQKGKKNILKPIMLIASLLLAGAGWGIVIGVENSTIVQSIFSNWVYGVTMPLFASTFMAVFANLYYASLTGRGPENS